MNISRLLNTDQNFDPGIQFLPPINFWMQNQSDPIQTESHIEEIQHHQPDPGIDNENDELENSAMGSDELIEDSERENINDSEDDLSDHDDEVDFRNDLTFNNLSRDPNNFKKQLGVEIDEFQLLFEMLGDAISSNPPRQGRLFRLSRRTRLVLYLLWLKQGFSYSQFSSAFGVSISVIRSYILQMNQAFAPILDAQIKWLNLTQQDSHLAESNSIPFHRVVSVIDATVQQCQRKIGWDAQKEYFSGKHHMHALKTQVACTPVDGLIMHVSPTFPGSVHDKTVFDQSDIASKVRYQEKLLADSGYQGIQHSVGAILPIKRKRGVQLTREEKIHNKSISQRRVIIENVFLRLKKWHLFDGKWNKRIPQSIGIYNRAFRNVAGIYNLLLSHKLDL